MNMARSTRRGFLGTRPQRAWRLVPRRAALHRVPALKRAAPTSTSTPTSAGPGTHDPPMTAEGLVRWMDEHNVAKAVVLPLVSPESSSYLNLTEQALDAAKAVPRPADPVLLHRPADVVHRGQGRAAVDDQGLRRPGGEGIRRAQGRAADRRPQDDGLYEVCDELKLAGAVSYGRPARHGPARAARPGAGPEGVPDRQLPRATGRGSGRRSRETWVPTISAAYPKGPVKPGGALDRLFDAYPESLGRPLGRLGAGAISRDRDVRPARSWSAAPTGSSSAPITSSPARTCPSSSCWRASSCRPRCGPRSKSNARKLLGLGPS